MITRTRRSHVITLTLSLLGAGAALGVGNDASAATPAVTVSYSDLNLAQPADVQTLYQRLQRAAAAVCNPAPERELSRHLAYTRCYQTALDSAVLEVGSPELLALAQRSAAPKV